jgi:hypothetical protein
VDEFKKATMEIITAYDLIGCPVHYRPSERRELLKMVRRRARRKLKQDLNKVFKIVSVFSAHEELYGQQKEKITHVK